MLASAGAVALVTASIELLKPYVPVLSLGVLYVFAVLPVAIAWGTAYALLGRGRVDARVQLLLPAAAVHVHAGGLAQLVRAARLRRHGGRRERARGRARGGGPASRRCWLRSRRRCSSTGTSARSSSGSRPRRRGRCRSSGRGSSWRPSAADGDDAYPLAVGRRRVGTIYLEGRAAGERGGAPAAAAGARLAARRGDRPRAARREALEAEALRRSDAVKTARPARGQPRPALAADGDPDLRGRARPARLLARPRRPAASSWRRFSARRSGSTGSSSNLLDLSRLQAGAAQPELGALGDRRRDRPGTRRGRRDRRPRRGVLPDESPAVRVDIHQIERVLVEPDRERAHATRRSPSPCASRSRRRLGGARPRRRSRAGNRRRASWSGSSSRSSAARGVDVRGAGLGLAIARGFAEANGGRVWAESRQGQGARSCSRSQPRRRRSRCRRDRAARARRRRRAADPARAADEPARRPGTRSTRPTPRRARSRRRRCIRPRR